MTEAARMTGEGVVMREFEDAEGRLWAATVRERPGPDYQGRYCFSVRPADSPEDPGIPLVDVRWNSIRTAERTLKTMSEVELRRRLRSAVGRRTSPSDPRP